MFQDLRLYRNKETSGKNYVIMVNNGKTIDSSAVEASTIYLRASAVYGSGAAHYFDGKAVPGTGTASSCIAWTIVRSKTLEMNFI